jgi:hypothetical protein
MRPAIVYTLAALGWVHACAETVRADRGGLSRSEPVVEVGCQPERFLHRPPVFDPVGDGVPADARLFGPRDQCLRFAERGNHLVRSAVPGLLGSRRPPNVAWLVSARVIDPVELMSVGRRLLHVGEKILKAGHPPIAHGDACAAIGVIAVDAWVHASADHGPPRPVKAGPVPPVLLVAARNAARRASGNKLSHSGFADAAAVAPHRHLPHSALMNGG